MSPPPAVPPPAAPGPSGPSGRKPGDLRKLFETWMDSEKKALILVFYRNNPGVVETLEGLARRLGTTPEALREPVEAHVGLGLIEMRELGGKVVLVFNRERRREMERFIEEEVRRRMGEPS